MNRRLFHARAVSIPAFHLMRRVLLGAALCVTLVLSGLTAQAETCEFYPIALSADTVADVAPGTVLDDILNGAHPGNFGWLTWTGDPRVPTLVNSLTPPGDSDTYVNPDDPSIFVEKRFGLGYTINFANPRAVGLLVGFLLLIAILTISAFLLT